MLHQLLHQLNSRNKAVRQNALREVRALPPDQLLQLAAVEAKHFRHWWWRGLMLNCLLFVLGGWLIMQHFPFLGIAGFALTGAVAPFLGWFLLGHATTRSRQALVDIIEHSGDLRLIPIALEMLQYESVAHDPIAEMLKRLLPRLRFEDTRRWNPEQKKALLAPLQHPMHDADLTFGILKALEQVGDATAEPLVRHLSMVAQGRESWGKMPSNRHEADWQRIGQAALDCLPFLEQNTAERKHSQTLLRASDPAPADNLLHPLATTLDQMKPEELLRPRSGE